MLYAPVKNLTGFNTGGLFQDRLAIYLETFDPI